MRRWIAKWTMVLFVPVLNLWHNFRRRDQYLDPGLEPWPAVNAFEESISWDDALRTVVNNVATFNEGELYRADSRRLLWERTPEPGIFEEQMQRYYNGKELLKDGVDCGAAAAWIARKMQRFHPALMLVGYGESGDVGSHYVVVFSREGKYFCISNWGKSSEYDTYDELIKDHFVDPFYAATNISWRHRWRRYSFKA